MRHVLDSYSLNTYSSEHYIIHFSLTQWR